MTAERLAYADGSEDVPMFEAVGQRATASELRRARRAPAAAEGLCPCCANVMAKVDVENGHMVWRIHTKVLFYGDSMMCGASGGSLCTMPPRDSHLVVRRRPGDHRPSRVLFACPCGGKEKTS